MICLTAWGQEKRKIIIDQDAAGPGGTDQQSILLLIQSPQTEVLGVTVVTGDAWLKSEVAHTLRMLELIGRTDIPVVAGAEYPLVRRKDETELWQQRLPRNAGDRGEAREHWGALAQPEGSRAGRGHFHPYADLRGATHRARSRACRGLQRGARSTHYGRCGYS
jgi:hypothetical protein